jgi:hypothetical protein
VRVLAICGLLVFASVAYAQWSTPDSNNDIHTVNTRHVAIGNGSAGDILLGTDYKGTSGVLKNYSTGHYSENVPSALTFGIGDGAYAGITVKNVRDGSYNSQSLAFDTHHGGVTAGTRMVIDKHGNVGIGTTSPSKKLHVVGTVLIDSGSGTGQLYRPDAAGVAFLVGNGTNISYGDFEFRNAFGDQIRVVVQDGGNVGIGTSSPSSKLEVAGAITATGTNGTISGTHIIAKYQDIAEWVPSARLLSPGTVVIVDSDGANTVLPSNQSYDTRVAGVVSATPGIILGEQGEGKVKVATTGRVKVRVDATTAPIRIGDLLVTSDKEGVAMRSQPIDVAGRKIHQPGTLIGKALEALDGGEGEILVLLSLQ